MMFKIGDVVYHDELYFKDGCKDTKQNRPCIVIYNNSEENYVLTIPLTSQIKSFNKKNLNYFFIPDVIYNYRKLNFVKLDNINKSSYDNTHEIGISINIDLVEKILLKLKRNNKTKYVELIDLIIESINIEKNKEEKEEKKQKKLERQLKRKEAKTYVG